MVDAWRSTPAHARRDMLWEALWARVCTWRDVARELEVAPRVAGRRDLERVLGWFATGATSPLEVRAKHETFRGPAFRDMEWQVALDLSGRRVVVDMVHRAAMVAVELDGDRYHSTRGARETDRARQNALVAAGFTVLRFGWRDIVERGPECRDLLAATLRRLRPASR
ncbi:endonuclease domain-containing protein [Demequina litorisediminis]|nr:DUF559 domain-containing protein [Demequina litorisediminis]